MPHRLRTQLQSVASPVHATPSANAPASGLLQMQTNPRATADTPLARFLQTRSTTDWLCHPLATDDYGGQSMPEASPTKWHIAHTSWFFEEFVLQAAIAGYRWFDPTFRYLFNSYYEAVGPRHSRPERGLLSRPTVDQVRAYRAHVDHEMRMLLERDVLPPYLQQVTTLGLHHEQQHQELLLTDIKHLF